MAHPQILDFPGNEDCYVSKKKVLYLWPKFIYQSLLIPSDILMAMTMANNNINKSNNNSNNTILNWTGMAKEVIQTTELRLRLRQVMVPVTITYRCNIPVSSRSWTTPRTTPECGKIPVFCNPWNICQVGLLV